MGGWQITAKTVYCQAVDDEVTLIVSKDASARCTGALKYTRPNAVTLRMIKQKIRRLKRPLRCQEGNCSTLKEYRDKILAEEKL